MNTVGPDFSEGTVGLFTWLAEKMWGGAKRAFGWGWNQAQWNRAQDVYDAAIVEQYGKIRIFGQATPKSLRDIFTDVYVLDTPSAYRRFNAETLADHLWNEDRGVSFRQGEAQPGERVLEQGTKFYILGKPGAGKTTFLKRLVVREAQRGRWGRCVGKVPIFISLKQLDESGKSLFDFIVDQFAVCHFPQAEPFIRGMLEAGQALVLFDGLDEVIRAEEFRADRRGRAAEEMEQFARQYSDCHIVITCRIAATDFTFGPEFTYLEMSDFSPEQVAGFVRNWFHDDADAQQSADLAEQMLEELDRPEHAGIRDLARSPLLLTLLCLGYEETRSFPARRVEIYKEALDALLKKWDNSRNIRRESLYRTLSLGRKRKMFAQIAYDAFARNEILFRQADLEEQIKSYLQHVPEIPESIDIEADIVLREIIEQHGIFSEQARGLFSFAHLTFQEYYAAQYISDAASPEVMQTLFRNVDDGRWREIFLLTASLLRDGTHFLTEFESALQQLAARSPQVAAWLRLADKQARASATGYRQPAIRAWLVAARDPALARDLHLELARARDRARARDLDCDLDRDFNRDRDRNRFKQLRVETTSFKEASRQFGPLTREDAVHLTAYLQATSLFYDCLQLAYVPDRRAFEERMFLPPPPAEG